jgi:hypothetical protein
VLAGSVAGYAGEFGFWKRGMLPNAGTHRDQPHKYISAMLEIESWISKRRENEQ